MKAARGFTLLEMIIALGVAAVVMVGVVAVVNAQQSAYLGGQHQRGAQTQGRAAIQLLEQHAVAAGYGVDPAYAFDFGWYSGDGWCPAGQSCVAAQRDQINGSDELVFYSRNPNYWVPDNGASDPRGHAWRLVGLDAATDTLTLKAFPGATFLRGQVLQLVCMGANQYAYVTVATTTAVAPLAASAPEPAAGTDTAIALEPAVAENPFRRQDVATHACFTTGNARVFQIDRYRFHVRPVVVAGSGTTAQFDPYLVLDRGVDLTPPDGVGPEDEQILAEGIESLQIAYVFTDPALTVAGATSGTAVTFIEGATGSTTADMITRTLFPGAVAAGQGAYSATSWYGFPFGPPLAPQRTTNHQANISALRIAVVARSNNPDSAAAGAPVLAFNQSSSPSWVTSASVNGRDGFQRVQFETTIVLRNMTATGLTWF